MKVVYSRQRIHVKKPTGKTTAGDILKEKIDLLFAMKQSKTRQNSSSWTHLFYPPPLLSLFTAFY